MTGAVPTDTRFLVGGHQQQQQTPNHLSALDQFVAPGLRLWMLIALVGGVLLIMIVIVCCFMRIRIPRTKRQIDLIAAKRKMRNKKKSTENPSHGEERTQAIVMNSMRPTGGGSGPQSARALVHSEAGGSKIHTQV